MWFRIFLFFTMFPICLNAQQSLSFELLFGTYTDDHYARKSYYTEHKWALNGNQFAYTTIYNNRIYADTFAISKQEISELWANLDSLKLAGNIEKRLQSNLLEKHEYSEEIRGTINHSGNLFAIDVRANAPNMISNDYVGKALKSFQDLLFEIVDREREAE